MSRVFIAVMRLRLYRDGTGAAYQGVSDITMERSAVRIQPSRPIPANLQTFPKSGYAAPARPFPALCRTQRDRLSDLLRDFT